MSAQSRAELTVFVSVSLTCPLSGFRSARSRIGPSAFRLGHESMVNHAARPKVRLQQRRGSSLSSCSSPFWFGGVPGGWSESEHGPTPGNVGGHPLGSIPGPLPARTADFTLISLTSCDLASFRRHRNPVKVLNGRGQRGCPQPKRARHRPTEASSVGQPCGSTTGPNPAWTPVLAFISAYSFPLLSVSSKVGTGHVQRGFRRGSGLVIVEPVRLHADRPGMRNRLSSRWHL